MPQRVFADVCLGREGKTDIMVREEKKRKKKTHWMMCNPVSHPHFRRRRDCCYYYLEERSQGANVCISTDDARLSHLMYGHHHA